MDNQNSKKISGKNPLLIAGVVALLIIGGVAWLVTAQMTGKPSLENNSGQTTNDTQIDSSLTPDSNPTQPQEKI